MKNFLASVKAFLSDPLKFLVDPANAVMEFQVKEMAAQGATMAEIDQSLSDAGMIKGKGPLAVVWDGVTNTLAFVQKNLAAIVLVAVILVIGWYFLAVFRLAKA